MAKFHHTIEPKNAYAPHAALPAHHRFRLEREGHIVWEASTDGGMVWCPVAWVLDNGVVNIGGTLPEGFEHAKES